MQLNLNSLVQLNNYLSQWRQMLTCYSNRTLQLPSLQVHKRQESLLLGKRIIHYLSRALDRTVNCNLCVRSRVRKQSTRIKATCWLLKRNRQAIPHPLAQNTRLTLLLFQRGRQHACRRDIYSVLEVSCDLVLFHSLTHASGGT